MFFFPRIRHVCTAVLICISSAVCKFTFFYPVGEFWHYVYSNSECALWGESATTLQPACLHSRLGGESTHYEPRRRAPQRSNWASSVEYRAEAAIQSIKLLCGFKAQKRHKHWPGHMHRHAQAAQRHGDTDMHPPTHTHHAHLVAAQGWWKRKGIDFHWLSLWGENKMQSHVGDFRKSTTPDTFCFVVFPLSLLITNSWPINRNIYIFL